MNLRAIAIVLSVLSLTGCGSSPAFVVSGRPALPMQSRWQHDAGRAADVLKAMRRRRPPRDAGRRTAWLQELFQDAQRAARILDRLDEAGPDERLFAAVAWGAILEVLLRGALPPSINLAEQSDLQPAFTPLGRLILGAYQTCVWEEDAQYRMQWLRFCQTRVNQFEWSRNVAVTLIEPPELAAAVDELPEPAWPPGRAFSVFFVEEEEEEDDYYQQEDEEDEEDEEEADEDDGDAENARS